MKKKFLIAAVALAFAGCAAMPGSSESPIPPRIVMKDKLSAWDNPSKFGSVPASRKTQAAKVCATLNTKTAQFEARGYHSKAQDLNGKTFPDGGYYCVRK